MKDSEKNEEVGLLGKREVKDKNADKIKHTLGRYIINIDLSIILFCPKCWQFPCAW